MEITPEVQASFKELTADMMLDDLIGLWTDLSAFRFLLRKLITKEIANAL